MNRSIERKHTKLRLVGLAALAFAMVSPAMPVAAQASNPAYAAARAAGQVGEQVDGYLGFPSSPTAEVRRTAEDVNIKRRSIYAERAAANHSTIEEYAFTTACQLILKTRPGERYQAPDGSWQTRGTQPPLRSAQCLAAGPSS